MKKQLELQMAEQLGITLKKIKTFSGHDGMMGINADICVNGRPFAHAYDDAYGGEMRIDILGGLTQTKSGDYAVSDEREKSKKVYAEVMASLKLAPPIVWSYDGGEEYSRPMGLDDLVNALVDAHIAKKDEKKGVVFHEKNKKHIQHIRGWKTQIPTLIKKYGEAVIVKDLQEMVDEELKKESTILNQEYLQSIGVKF
jgi:hypothetical protein